MRTRRSWRNQDRLWRELGGPKPEVKVVEVIPRCWDCANYPKGGRSRGACTLIGEMVRGASQKPCFLLR